MQSYLKYKRYYDKKGFATPLQINDYCYNINPKADNQSMKFAFKDCTWTGPNKVFKVLSNNNYFVRRRGSRYNQTLYIIRPRLYAPNQAVPDVTVREEGYLPDPDVQPFMMIGYAQDWETDFGEILFGQPREEPPEEAKITEIDDNSGSTA